MMLGSARQADRTIQSLLDVASMRAGKIIALQLTECDLGAEASQMIEEIDRGGRNKLKSGEKAGTTFTLGQSINNAGDIVGQFYDSANVGHGYLLHAGAYTVIDYPGAAVTSIDGINNKGQMVGAYGTGGYVLGWDAWNGFLTDSSGTFTSFDAPLAAAPVTRPLSINDKGEIAGFYTDVNATYFGFVASFK